MTILQTLRIYYNQVYRLKTTYSLSLGELGEIKRKILQITDTLIRYENKFYKVTKVYSNKNFDGGYDLKHIKINKIDLLAMKNSTDWFTQHCWTKDYEPALKKLNIQI